MWKIKHGLLQCYLWFAVYFRPNAKRNYLSKCNYLLIWALKCSINIVCLDRACKVHLYCTIHRQWHLNVFLYRISVTRQMINKSFKLNLVLLWQRLNKWSECSSCLILFMLVRRHHRQQVCEFVRGRDAHCYHSAWRTQCCKWLLNKGKLKLDISPSVSSQ